MRLGLHEPLNAGWRRNLLKMVANVVLALVYTE
jgi:hypothetical protein